MGLLTIGFSPILIRFAAVPGTVAAFYRMAIGLLALTPVFLLRLRQKPPLPKQEIRIAILGGVLFAIDLSFWSTGVMLSGATNPTLLANTAPIWVGIGALLLFKEKLSPSFWIGLAISLVGATLVLGFDALQALELGLGTFLGLISGIFYGSYFLVTQRGRRTLSALAYFWFSGASATVLLLLINLMLNQPLLGYSLPSYASLLALGVLAQGFGWMAITYAQGHLPATVVAPTLLGQPVVAAILALPLLGESLAWVEIVGGLIVLSGIYLVHRSRVNANARRYEISST